MHRSSATLWLSSFLPVLSALQPAFPDVAISSLVSMVRRGAPLQLPPATAAVAAALAAVSSAIGTGAPSAEAIRGLSLEKRLGWAN